MIKRGWRIEEAASRARRVLLGLLLGLLAQIYAPPSHRRLSTRHPALATTSWSSAAPHKAGLAPAATPRRQPCKAWALRQTAHAWRALRSDGVTSTRGARPESTRPRRAPRKTPWRRGEQKTTRPEPNNEPSEQQKNNISDGRLHTRDSITQHEPTRGVHACEHCRPKKSLRLLSAHCACARLQRPLQCSPWDVAKKSKPCMCALWSIEGDDGSLLAIQERKDFFVRGWPQFHAVWHGL